jgi:mRNA interferase HicA
MKLRDLAKHPCYHGCQLLREGARHSWWVNVKQNRRTAVPRHCEVNDKLILKICKDLEFQGHIRRQLKRDPSARPQEKERIQVTVEEENDALIQTTEGRQRGLFRRLRIKRYGR